MRRAFMWVSLSIAAAGGASLEGQDTVRIGDRVRFLAEDGERVSGVVMGISDSTLSFLSWPLGVATTVPAQEVVGLQASSGFQTNFTRSFLYVAASSAIGVGFVFAFSGVGECDQLFCWRGGDALLVGTAIGAGLGIPAGVIAGLRFRTERWRPARVPPPAGR